MLFTRNEQISLTSSTANLQAGPLFTMSSAWLCQIVLAILGFAIPGSSAAADEKGAPTPELPGLLTTFRSEFVTVTPGRDQFPAEFSFGPKNRAEHPQIRIKLTSDFEVSRFETYQALYEAVTGANPSRWKGSRNSVDSVTIEGANEFCQKMTILMRDAKLIKADQVVRLPTEVEWEYCCRAGTETDYSFGDQPRKDSDDEKTASILGEYGWYLTNSPGNDPAVGTLKPNPWGLYDMHGYLWEICSDHWSESLSEPAASPHAPFSGADDERRCSMRGGSWKDGFVMLKSSSRRPITSLTTNDAVGFRCVIAPEASTK
ncbi:MAG: formylglycine-generating enzyme family protein [Planctomycetota bacterium]